MNEHEIEALVVDRYLEALLARHPAGTDGLAGGVQATAERLTRDLPRFHPSFRFEEHLATRLAAAAHAHTAGMLSQDPATRAPEEEFAAIFAFPVPVVVRPSGSVRPVVIGGVLTSAAISVAGAAYVAWRRSHAPAGPMVRAARAVARARTA